MNTNVGVLYPGYLRPRNTAQQRRKYSPEGPARRPAMLDLGTAAPSPGTTTRDPGERITRGPIDGHPGGLPSDQAPLANHRIKRPTRQGPTAPDCKWIRYLPRRPISRLTGWLPEMKTS